MKTIAILLSVIVGCATDPITEPTAPDYVHTVTWSAAGASDSPGVPGPVICTGVVSHPCPFMLYTHSMTIEPTFDVDGTETLRLTWTDASGGSDVNGRTAETIAPIEELDITVSHGAIQLPDRGDDGGLRHASELVRDNHTGIFTGDVSWSLFNVAGHTTWHIVIAPE